MAQIPSFDQFRNTTLMGDTMQKDLQRAYETVLRNYDAVYNYDESVLELHRRQKVSAPKTVRRALELAKLRCRLYGINMKVVDD